MEAKDIVDILSDNDIWQLLEDLNAEPKDLGHVFAATTVCHNGDSDKLVFYKDSRNFYCYTHCHSMSIFNFIMNTLDIDFKESMSYLINKFNIDTVKHYENGFEYNNKIENPGDILNNKLKTYDYNYEMNYLDDKVLDNYYDFYHQLWLNEYINISSMKDFEIKYDILENKIIIPHRDKDGNLLGVRARNLNKNLVDDGKKYMPVFINGNILKHPTGSNLYGLYNNKEKIIKHNTCILFESEKSVLQLKSFANDLSIGVCISGNSLTNYQLELLKGLGIEEVIIGVDKEYENIGSKEEKFYAEKIEKTFFKKLSPFFKVSVLWDVDSSLNLKDSPTDKGKEVFLKLFKNRIFLK